MLANTPLRVFDVANPTEATNAHARDFPVSYTLSYEGYCLSISKSLISGAVLFLSLTSSISMLWTFYSSFSVAILNFWKFEIINF